MRRPHPPSTNPVARTVGATTPRAAFARARAVVIAVVRASARTSATSRIVALATVLAVVSTLATVVAPALASSRAAVARSSARPSTSSGPSSGVVSYGGDAYAVGLSGVSVEGRAIGNTTLGDTGRLPGIGGALSTSPGTITLPAGLGALTVTAAGLTGVANTVNASERVAGVRLLPNMTSPGGLCLPLVGCISSLVGGSVGGLASGAEGPAVGGAVGGVIGGLLGAGLSRSGDGRGPSSSGNERASDLVDIGLAQSSASVSATSPAAAKGNTDIGSISLLGGAVNVPIDPAPNTQVNLGLLDLTLNRRSYDAATNTSSAQAVVLEFPADGQLAPSITGTLTFASSTATLSGTPSCPSGISVTGVGPSSGPVTGGTPVTIAGTRFVAGTRYASGTTVAFGNTPATRVRVVSSTIIHATAPPQSAGTVTVSVNGCPASAASFGYGSSPPVREGGSNRIQTAIYISQKTFPDADSASAVVLSTDLNYPDGLAGVPLAAHVHGPLLLTEPTSQNGRIDPAVLTEIRRVLGTLDHKPIYLLGGSSALAPPIATALSGLGYRPILLAGSNRFSTAVAIANEVGDASTVFLATGLGFGDALSAGPAAVHQGGVVLLTDGTAMAPETAAYLSAHPGDSVFAVGGPAVAADPAATPIAGADEFATDALVAAFFGNPAMIGVARGDLFPDALDGGAQVAADGGPIILVNPSLPLPPPSEAYFKVKASDIQTAAIYGGTGALTPPLVATIGDDLARAPAG